MRLFSLSISKKLLILFLVAVLLPLFFITLVTLRLVESTMSQYNQDEIKTNLKAAWGIYDSEMERILDGARILASLSPVKEAVLRKDIKGLREKFLMAKATLDADVVDVFGAYGEVLYKTNNYSDQYSLAPLVREALKGEVIASTEVLSPREVEIEDDGLFTYTKQCTIFYRYTPRARAFRVEKSVMGMALVTIYPLLEDYEVIGAIMVIKYLARNYSIVDKITETVGEGTSTIFQNDVRISTNVMDQSNKRAVGTQVSEDVYNHVIKEGKPWNQRAFVVNDWYISSYEPIKNHAGEIIGMLYVGTKEKFFIPLRRSMVTQIYLIASGALVVSIFLSLLFSRTITRPIVQIIEKSKIIAKGDLETKIDVERRDELGDLATALNQMTSQLLEVRKDLLAKNRMARELEIAYTIQQRLLVEEFPTVMGLEIASDSLPATEVGGDFYDFLKLTDGKSHIVIGDVAGKGMSAAMFMGIVRSIIRAESTESPDAAEVMRKSNRLVCLDAKSGMFVTVFYATFDERTAVLEYCNAGHAYPLLYDPGKEKFEYLNTEGRPLGITEESTYESKTHRLEAGQLVILYTDGIVESVDASNTPFGEERIREVIAKSSDASPREIIQKIKASIATHSGTAPQSDDMTLIVLKRV
ncbi:MAG: SpoIIE family protein phosphatase [Proteobacteria bacterium]|nr:SpoIIE family protein phosphatase [Pseudomonadota bacterium]NIS71734.1 SpoIIE family protein phosphatase [Pseudomonadota bacterium]